MKKLLKISLGALLAALPVMAGAAVTDADPGQTMDSTALTTAGKTEAQITAAAPKYAIEPENTAIDGTLATVGYVKGAYNAVIKGVNAVQGEINEINTNLNSYATQSDVTTAIGLASVNSGTISNAAIDSGATFDVTALNSQTIDGTLTARVALAGTWGDTSTTTGTASAAWVDTSVNITGDGSGTIAGSATVGYDSANLSVDSYVQG